MIQKSENKQSPSVGSTQLLAGIIANLEYAAYNLLDKKYTDLPAGIIESTDAGDTLLIAIRDLKEIAC